MAIKLAVGIWAHSVGLFSEGIHSALDLVSAAIAFFTIREAGKPADEDHPFGHGKIETLSSLVESLLLVVASVFIVMEGLKHVKNPEPLEHAGYAIATIGTSLFISYFVYLHNAKAARQTDSSAIEVNALHFLADAVTAGGVLIALVAIHYTGAMWLDPAIAFLIAGYILAISWRQVVRSVRELTDRVLPSAEVASAEKILASFKPRVIEVHELRTRKSGAHRHFDFHAIFCGKMTVNESHFVCDEMEDELQAEFPGSLVSIHVEPCGHPGVPIPAHCSRTTSGVCEANRKGSQ
ncbi:MAG: cation transporter [Cryobacterium sp.]|nr:cation transporter [Oligoflexia bacterium]